MRIYAYLRSSTKEQDVERAKDDLIDFSRTMNFNISAWFMEHESGSKLERIELFRLLNLSEPGDVLLVEQVDRISRLDKKDWEQLKSIILTKKINIVALDLPTSYQLLEIKDEFTERMLSAINSMMLDMLTAISRKDYDDRKRRQRQGVENAKDKGKYRGRKRDTKKRMKIRKLLELDQKITYNEIQEIVNCSRHTISSVVKEMRN